MTDAPGPDRDRGTSERDDTDPLPIIAPPDRGDADAGSGGDAAAISGGAGRAGRWRWAVLAVLVVVLAVAAANAWLAAAVEDRVAEEVERELGAPVDVRLEGFPVGFRSLTGRLPAAELRGRDVPLPDTAATASEVRLSLTEVRVDRDRGRVEAARADVTATLEEPAVEELLGVLGRLPLVGIELQPGVLRLSVAGFAAVDTAARADDGDLVVGLTAPLDRLVPGELRWEDLPLGLRLDDVRLHTGEMELDGHIEPLVLDSRGPSPGR